MTDRAHEAEVRQALQDLNRYLSDQVAPLMVADALVTLMRTSPEVTASSIHAWAGGQRRLGQDATLSDYLFHALRKIQLMAHLSLVAHEPMTAWMESLVGLAIRLCPEDERAAFAEMAKGIGQLEGDPAEQVQVLHLHGAAGAGAKAASPATGAPGIQVSEAVARGLRRFSLLVDRLEKLPEEPGRREEAVTQALGMAAVQAQNSADLEQYLQRLKRIGIEPRTDQLFRALGRSLPAWILPDAAEGAAAVTASRPAEAMHRLLSMADSMEEARRRFAEVVQAAVEQFNEGQLVRAAAMLEVAERVVTDHKIDPDSARVIRMRAQERVSEEMLRHFSEKPDRHRQLRRVLAFFPGFSVQGLLESLDGEPKRERRKWLMALLEAHGADARRMAFQQAAALMAGGDPDVNGYYLRNLISMLRRIPMPPDADSEKELSLLAELARWGRPPLVIKESLGALRGIKGARTEKVVTDLMRDTERILLKGEMTEAEVEDLHQILDRCASALVWQGSINALRTVANHAFRTEPALGDTLRRLVDLGSQDLSPDKELVDRLVASLRAALPKKVLGFTMQKNNARVMALVQALASTPSNDVKGVLREIVERYPTEEFGQAATRTLAAFTESARGARAAASADPAGAAAVQAKGAAATVTPGSSAPAPHPAARAAASAAPAAAAATPALSGDLELFALPMLVQTVADGRMGGTLTLSGRDGLVQATVTFEDGKIRTCTVDALSGENAFFQLFERPVAGTFSFRNHAAPKGSPGAEEATGELMEVLPAMLEGMRRYDELQQARSVVPDDTSLKPTQVKPTAPSDEKDKALLMAVWREASRGSTPAVCEKSLPVDSYRIRRLYVHWLEQGALQPAA